MTHIEWSPEHVDGLLMCRSTHRSYHLFHDVCWYYEYITSGGSPVPHLPDRALQQYGHIQSIPPSPHVHLPMPPITDVHAHFLHYHDHLLDESRRGPLMTYSGECTDGYLDLFKQVSHPYRIPHEDRVHDRLPSKAPRFRTPATPGGT
ncbi:hypothetical protein SESBI_17103 [Sesbania bispinosa]|nr:hypothetical protein SESBI_17103 [Sesbania bispinosa]